MIRLSIDLPTGRRLDMKIVKSRKLPADTSPILPDLGKLMRVRKGSKISRFFRHIFENKKVARLSRTNLAVILALTPFILSGPKTAGGLEENTITAPVVLITEKGSRYPLDRISITQGFKWYHPGIDFDGDTGDPVYPVVSGTVTAVQYSNHGYGNAVLIGHGGKISSLYAHLDKIHTNVGEDVTIDTVIGTVGSTGWASGDHLHFEIRDDGLPINPYTILPRK